MDPNNNVEVGISMTIRNLNNVMKAKQREFKPNRRRISKFGTHTVNVRRHTVGAYEV